jgi:hypothetical protein
MEHFVLSHSKGVPVGRPAEGSVTLLAILVSAVAVVRMGKVCATICTLVASVCNTNVIIQESSISIKRRNVIQLQLVNSKSLNKSLIVPCPEYWSVILTVPNCTSLVPLYESHFLLEIELQQEGAARGVRNVSTIAGFPFERSVGGDGLAEFSADEGNCVRNVVAIFVELGSFE